MSADACGQFELHAWKTETCANCMKPRSQHSGVMTSVTRPQPAKRQSKFPAVASSSIKAEVVAEKSVDSDKLNSPGKKPVSVSDMPASRLPVIGAKPSPIKAKPTFGVKPEKPEKPRKPSIPTENSAGPEVSTEKTTEQVSVDSNTSCDQQTMHAAQTDDKMGAKNNGDIKISNLMDDLNKTSQAAQAVAASPEQKPSSHSTKTSHSHYYQVYDVSAKGLSGKPVPITEAGTEVPDIGSQCRTRSMDRNTNGTLRNIRVLEMSDDQIAMPYNVVDVTVLPIRTDNAPVPQLPQTPAPPGNTWPATGKPQPTKRETTTLRNSPVSHQRASRSPISKSTAAASTDETISDSSIVDDYFSCQEQAVSNLTPSEIQALRYAHRIYEDIDDSDDRTMESNVRQPTATARTEFTRQTDSRASAGKSSAFEAKVAALASLDLGKSVKPVGGMGLGVSSGGQESPPIKQQSDVSFVVTAEKDASSSAAAGAVVVPISKPEKSKKTGGKTTFFQKLLKLGGSKESASEPVKKSEGEKSPCVKDQDSSSANVSDAEIQDTKQQLSASASPSRDLSCSPPVAVQPERQAVLMNLKDCLAKRQLSAGTGITFPSQDGSNPKDLSNEEERQAMDVSQYRIKEIVAVPAVEVNTLPAPIKPAPRVSLRTGASHTSTASSLSASPNPVLDKTSLDSSGVYENDFQLSSEAVDSPETSGSGKGLTVVTEVSSTGECPVSPCPSDTVSPSLSDSQLSDSADASLRRRSRADMKQMRKMMGAPPPPPLVDVKSATATGATVPEEVIPGLLPVLPAKGPSAERTSRLSADIAAAIHGNSPIGTSMPLSHSLPRPTAKRSLPIAETSDIELLDEQSMRRADTLSKHTRSKTVTEGIKFDTQQWPEADNRTDEERLSDLTDSRRASKFFNRALPEPPVAPAPPNTNSHIGSSLDDLDNLYELVSQSVSSNGIPAVDDATSDQQQQAGKMYEDIDGYFEHAEAILSSFRDKESTGSASSDPSSRGSSGRKTVSGNDEYLEPVIQPGEEVVLNRRPLPAPRSPQISYVNSQMVAANSSAILTMVSDGFEAMSGVCLEALKQIAANLYSAYFVRLRPSSSDGAALCWTDFELLEEEPQLVQHIASFYSAKHSSLAPTGCTLMVLTASLQKPLSEQLHPHVMSPLATFRSSDFTADNPTGNGDNAFDNVAVLPCMSVRGFTEYWHDQSQFVPPEQLERSACRTLVQLLQAVLHLHEHDWPTPRLQSRSIVMATRPSGECYPLVRPSTRVTAATKEIQSHGIAEDISELIVTMLTIDVGVSPAKAVANSAGDNASSRSQSPARIGSNRSEKASLNDIIAVVSSRSPYTRCLQRVLRCSHDAAGVDPAWDSGLRESIRLLEFVLWGPAEEEARLAAISDRRSAELRVWLSVARCQLLAEVAVGNPAGLSNLEIAERARFLTCATEDSLLDVTKTLFT